MLSTAIQDKSARIAVVGMGYVGLPLALASAEAGYHVLGIDSDEAKISQLAEGRSYASNVPQTDISGVLQTGRFRPTSKRGAVHSSDIVALCLPTPLTTEHRPDYSSILEVADYLAACAEFEQLIILESTVNPQFTTQQLLPRLASGRGRVGEDFYLGYSPERVDPSGRGSRLSDVSKIVSGVSRRCLALTGSFYRQLGVHTVPVSCPEIAEAAKVLENTYRDVNVALVNEMARVLSQAGIDVREVIEAASTKEYGFTPFYPGHGVGGHCIPVDSVLYAHWARVRGTPSHLVETARSVNDSMPEFAEQRLVDVLQQTESDDTPGPPRVFFAGVTYKKDVDDVRGSPTVELMANLVTRGWEVAFCDPMVESLDLGGIHLQSQDLRSEAFWGSDCVALSVAHRSFDLEYIADNAPLVLDMTGAMRIFEVGHVLDLFG